MKSYSKYSAKRTYSALCERTFDSKSECRRGEELFLLQKAGKISGLEFQVPFVLYKSPSVKIIIDFKYMYNGTIIYEDRKGFITKDCRVKLLWLKDKYNIDVLLSNNDGEVFSINGKNQSQRRGKKR